MPSWAPSTRAIALCLLTAASTALVGAQGRFLYAGDDDWDWASPLKAENPSKLQRYGKMEWSALDWAEEGLENVRGVLVGTPPDAQRTMSMPELSKLRGDRAHYRHVAHGVNVFKKLRQQEGPPNVIILMQSQRITRGLRADDIRELVAFVRGGGRVVVVDDWKRFRNLLEHVVQDALTLPPGPDPGERPAWQEPPKAKLPGPAPVKPDADMKKKFQELLPKLGDDVYKVREEATETLKEFGRPLLPLLEETKSDNPEIAFRLRRLAKELNRLTDPQKVALSAAKRDEVRRLKYIETSQFVLGQVDRLRQARIPHTLRFAKVDREGRPAPTLLLNYPAPEGGE